MTVEVWYPLGVAGAGASFAASGLVTLRSRVNTGLLAAGAAGALAAILSLDLLPDVRADALEAGVPAALLLAIALVAFAGLWFVGRNRPANRAAPIGPAFAIHGFLEGIAGGTVLGWQAGVGVGLVLGLFLHKAAEGADLAAALRGDGRPGEERATPSRRAWLVGGAAAPLVGCTAAIVLPVPDRLVAGVMTAVCCVLAGASLRLLRRAARSLDFASVVGAAALGVCAMATVVALLPS